GWDKSTRYFPVRYNFKTFVISPWADPIAPGDFTSENTVNPFLNERLQQLENDQSLNPLGKSCVSASLKIIPAAHGGPGKLHIFLKHICTKYSTMKEHLISVE
ncbi:hypothetical protein HK100_009294, partial [Physocladia obscura]